MPGIPASVTYATRWPSRTASTIQPAPSRSLCAWTARSRPAAAIPSWVSRARVRRVSSAAITSAVRKVSTARADRSPRLPIGVATSTSQPRPWRSRPELQAIARTQAPAVERTRLRLDHEGGAHHHRRQCATAQARAVRSTRPSASQNATSMAKRIPNVCTWRHGTQDHGAFEARHGRAGLVDAPATDRPSPPPPAHRRRARARTSLPPTHPLRKPDGHTLNRISSTSPSTTS